MARTRRATKSARKKRTYTKKKQLSVPRNMVSTGIGFPKKLMMTHKYAEVVTLINTSGAFNSYVFSANSIFDPNVTSTGHQPMYFDQLTALYNHYVVVGSKCKFTFTPSAVTSNTIRVAATIDDGGALTATSLDTTAENTLGKSVIILPAGNNDVKTRTLYYSAKKTFGKNPLANSNLRGSSTTSPAEQNYFIIASTGDAVLTTSLIVQVEVQYTVIWFELKDIAGS